MSPNIREVANGLKFPEGPVAVPNGDVLLVEIARGTLSRVMPDGTIEVVAETGGGPNGAAIGPDGKCYICNNGGHRWHQKGERLIPGLQGTDYSGGRIERVDLATGEVEVLYTECDGVPLKGPNDLVFDSEGGFWFTEFGKLRWRDRDRGTVYYALADGSRIVEVIHPVDDPNGIGLSADERTVYVAETHAGRMWAYEIAEPGAIVKGRGETGWQHGRLLAGSTDFLPVRFPGGGWRRQRLRRHHRQGRHHGDRARGRHRPARRDPGRRHGDQHLLRRSRLAYGLHHALVNRTAGGDGMAVPRIALELSEQIGKGVRLALLRYCWQPTLVRRSWPDPNG